jgi:Mlc titration factor MtfA (ptsG expression regulator)
MAAVALLGLLIVAMLALGPWLKARRHQRWRQQPFPHAWRRILRQRVPAVARLPADLQARLKQHMMVFLAEKPIIGCQGQVITDEVRVTIAAQACMLLLGQAAPDVYPRLRQVLVYPGAFAVPTVQADAGGVVHEQRQALAGQSWAQGQVILGWAEVLAGAANPHDGRNVVLHEFAHQIDQDKGRADGQPWLPGRARRQRWAQVMGEAFARQQWQASPVIDPYGATDPAEFLAVSTEAFFEQPQALAQAEPGVYRELARLYGVHPLVW